VTICRLAAFTIILNFSYLTSILAQQATVEPSDVLKTLDKSHPRLMLKDNDLQRLKELYAKDKVLHKEVGCIECLAHNCIKDFACLKAITVEEVLNTVESILT